MKVQPYTRRFIACPSCDARDGKGFGIDHLDVGRSFGPWYCDNCGQAIRGSVNADGTVELEVLAERKIETMDLLVLEPQAKPLYFIVGGMRFEGDRHRQRDDEQTEDDSKRYIYEEHSCPTNWLNPEAMRFDSDNDPHGVITYLGHVDRAALPAEILPHCGRQSWEYFTAFRRIMEQRGETIEDSN